MSDGARAVIGFGANVGERLASLASALERLAATPDVTCLATSRVYETAPVGPPQPDFLNAAALVRTSLSPRALLTRLLAIEAELGRVRRERWGPRVIDLDLLWYEGVVVDERDLTVPHPRLCERAFALAPLLDVVTDAADPRSGRPYEAPSATRLSDEGVRATTLRFARAAPPAP